MEDQSVYLYFLGSTVAQYPQNYDCLFICDSFKCFFSILGEKY